MNLFDKMDLSPVLTHGALEHGKDTVCTEKNRFGILEWIGAVVKVGKIMGGTSGSSSLQTVFNQLQEVLQHPYKNPMTKQKTRMNKVLVVTNGEVSETAREKLLEKLESLPTASANIHFLGETQLAALLDQYWPEFSTERADVMSPSDTMTPETGLVLYVLARARTLSGRRPKDVRTAELSLIQIVTATKLEEGMVREGLAYLLSRQYAAEQENERYSLHPMLTRGRLLKDVDQIRLLFAMEKLSDETNHLTVRQINRTAHKKSFRYTNSFVQETIESLVAGGYIAEDRGHGKGHYILNINMLDDERAYLECWRDYKGGRPSRLNHRTKSEG